MNGTGLRILAVDDEPRALADIERLLRAMPEVSGVECADAGEEALRRVAASSFDAVFLDVRIPGLDGLELARVLRRFASAPELVFVSAHDDAAVEAFELHALDYLRKPVARARLTEAVQRVAHARAGRSSDAAGHAEELLGAPGNDLDGAHDVVAVSALHGGATRLIERSEIQYVSSYGDFVHVVTGSSRFLLRSTLSEVERRWAPHGFVRVHRQFLANLRQAVELRPQVGGTAELVFADGATVPVARRHTAELARRLSV
ncbi:MAG TPA: LytTR family DNA-binding domain-containing protein [Solirubrobacteraceae bacterium]|nr:LytTR family DNA-binding domain-containing protein [Solirubrobacteraceae bacterium]